MGNEELVRELHNKMARCQTVIVTLENSEAWQIITEDYKQGEKAVDDSWVDVFDASKLKAFRIAKLASREINQLVNKYKQDLVTAEEQLFKIEHPDKAVTADWDNS